MYRDVKDTNIKNLRNTDREEKIKMHFPKSYLCLEKDNRPQSQPHYTCTHPNLLFRH